MAKKDTDLGEQFGNEKDGAYDKLKSNQEHSTKAKKVLAGAGYARGGGVSKPKHKDESQDKKLIKKELSNVKITPKKHGGKVDGKKPAKRADKFARGGSAPRGKHTAVNINLAASQADKADSFKKGAMAGAQMAAQKLGAGRPGAGAPMQARPPMAPPGAPAPGGAPMGGPPGVPPTMQKRGGRTYAKGGAVKDWTKGAGAGGAKGRLAKIETYGTKPAKK